MSAATSSQTVVTAAAAVTAVGPTIEQNLASVCAGIQRFTDHPLHTAAAPDPPLSGAEPAACALVPGLDAGMPIPERLLQLSLFAAPRFFSDVGWSRREVADAAVFWVLPEPARLASFAGYETLIAGEFLTRLGIGGGASRSITAGSGGFAEAVDAAHKHLESGQSRRAIVVALDSWIDRDSMQWLDSAYRLKSERNPDGFIPGEGCAIIALEPAAAAKARHAPALARIQGVAVSSEAAPFGSGRRSTASGLTQAIDGVASLLSSTEPLWVLCDMNGESCRAAEWGAVLCRSRRLKNVGTLWHPAENWGDVGAASGGLALALVCEAYRRNRAPNMNALIWNASDGSARGAVAVVPA
jgi:3-oxoacyl-[acyl-carrier-protein] synthase-1